MTQKPSPRCWLSSTTGGGSDSDNSQNDDEAPEESSMITLLEHVNINIPEHRYAIPFYFDILGCGMDPRRAQNVKKGSGTVWANCGASQFHLPYGETAQVIPGNIGLIYESLEPLQERLANEDKKSENDKCFKEYSIGTDVGGLKREHIRIEDKYGNIFMARKEIKSSDNNSNTKDFPIHSMKQPILYNDNVDHLNEFGKELVERYGKIEQTGTECLGIEYVEFKVPPSVSIESAGDDMSCLSLPKTTACKIAQFYKDGLGAITNVIRDTVSGDAVAIIGIGPIDETTGRPSQSLLFREHIPSNEDERKEQTASFRPYDGHHVAMYVGSTNEDFEETFHQADEMGVVWVNPRFSDKALDLSGAQHYKQFRFKDLIDSETGEAVFTLEHEIRSVEHDAWPGKNKKREASAAK